MNRELFEQVKRLSKTKSKSELLDITSLSKNVLNVLIRKIENFEGSMEPTFEELYGKPGRKKMNKDALHREIRQIMGNDNSLTQVGCRDKLHVDISLSQICKEFKEIGLTM